MLQMQYAFQLQQFEERLFGEDFRAKCLQFPLIQLRKEKPVRRRGCEELFASLLELIKPLQYLIHSQGMVFQVLNKPGIAIPSVRLKLELSEV